MPNNGSSLMDRLLCGVLATILSVVAIGAAVANFLFTQWRSDRRELDKWRRDEMLRLTARLLELSSQRQFELAAELDCMEGTSSGPSGDVDPWVATRRMSVIGEQLKLLDDVLAAAAERVIKLHRDASSSYYPHQNPYDDVGQLLIDNGQLEDAHRGLTVTFRARSGVRGAGGRLRRN